MCLSFLKHHRQFLLERLISLIKCLQSLLICCV
ncbi:hypothetical protein V6Z12_D11G358800 [Gossypium hirsutum]